MTEGPGTIRRIAFEYPDIPVSCWTPRAPEVAAAANGVSLLMPYAEPFVIRSISAVLDQLPESSADEARWMIRQEASHHHQHRRFNSLVVADAPSLGRIEHWMDRVFSSIESHSSPSFAVAFAAGFETVAFSVARWTDRHSSELFLDADPLPTTMFMWHLAEEVEHKSVAFDVHRSIGGTRRSYLTGALVSYLVLGMFTILATFATLTRSRRLLSPLVWWRLIRRSLSINFEVLPNIFAAGLRGHHPSQMADPTRLVAWLRLYDPETGTIPLWWVTSSSDDHRD